MTVKRKSPPHWTARATKSVRAHPWLTWTTLASIAAVLGVIPIVAPYLPNWQTAEAASAHEKQDAREFAALLYGQQRIETLILGKTVSDCRRTNKQNSRADCAEYEQQYRAARERERILYEKTQK